MSQLHVLHSRLYLLALPRFVGLPHARRLRALVVVVVVAIRSRSADEVVVGVPAGVVPGAAVAGSRRRGADWLIVPKRRACVVETRVATSLALADRPSAGR